MNAVKIFATLAVALTVSGCAFSSHTPGPRMPEGSVRQEQVHVRMPMQAQGVQRPAAQPPQPGQCMGKDVPANCVEFVLTNSTWTGRTTSERVLDDLAHGIIPHSGAGNGFAIQFFDAVPGNFIPTVIVKNLKSDGGVRNDVDMGWQDVTDTMRQTERLAGSRELTRAFAVYTRGPAPIAVLVRVPRAMLTPKVTQVSVCPKGRPGISPNVVPGEDKSLTVPKEDLAWNLRNGKSHLVLSFAFAPPHGAQAGRGGH